MTLQTCTITALGALLGPWQGAAAVGLYLLEGLFGAPVFTAGRAGALVLLGPTSGYLWAMAPAAWLSGTLWQLGRQAGSKAVCHVLTWLGCRLPNMAILLGGGVGLSQFFALSQAYLLGVGPFLAPELVKACLVWFMLMHMFGAAQNGRKSAP